MQRSANISFVDRFFRYSEQSQKSILQAEPSCGRWAAGHTPVLPNLQSILFASTRRQGIIVLPTQVHITSVSGILPKHYQRIFAACGKSQHR